MDQRFARPTTEGERMRTRLTEMLGVAHPVMLAGMGGVAYSELAAAVSEAGGSAAWGLPPWAPSRWCKKYGL
jgi:nitronate monooxygenase